MKCATHPDVETSLRCGKCGKPICPKCLVETPVGARCRNCAQLGKLPTYRVSLRHYLRALGASLGMAIACGVAWAFIDLFSPFFVDLLLAPAVGYAIGEVVSLSVNRKRGVGLAVVAGSGVVISYLVMNLLPIGGLPLGGFSLLELLTLALGIYFAANRMR